jgi:thiol-disulfide isomerase/thioredoxin
LASRPALDGRTFALPAQARFVVVNFWATWCPPCIEETPSLLRLAAERPDAMVLVTVSEDDSVADVRKFIGLFPNARRPNIYLLHDRDRALAERWAIRQFPETLIFDRGFALKKKVAGAIDWGAQDVVAFFSELSK